MTTLSKSPREILYDLNEVYGEEKYPLPLQYRLKTKFIQDETFFSGESSFKMYQAVLKGFVPTKPYKKAGEDDETMSRVDHHSSICCESEEAERLGFEDWLTFCNPMWREDVLELISPRM